MNAAELSAIMADRAEDIARYLLPAGKKASGEWKAGSVSGEPGQSLSVRLTGHKAGVWSDFAHTGCGGDLLDLWVASRCCSMAEAIREAKAYLGIRDDMPPRQSKTYTRPQKPQCTTPRAEDSPVRTWLRSRGLTDETIAAFRLAEYSRGGKNYVVLPYLRDGELINVKHRNIAEKRDMRQEKDAEPCLFGWHLIDAKARVVALTEGEIDAMTLHQCGIAALSVNQGAGNHQWIETDWERLERFSEIVICFDQDEAGKKGAHEVATRLGIERCKLANFGSHKDANEALQAGWKPEEFREAIFDAKSMDPVELVPMADFFGKVKALFYPTTEDRGDPVLRFGLKDFEWFEFRPSELSVWTGINGHGKTLMLQQVLLGLMDQGERVCVFSGEMSPERLGKRLVKQATGLDRPTPAYIDAVGAWVTDRMWIFNVLGSAPVDRLLEVFRYGAKRYGMRHFVIDSLMMTEVPEDGPGALSAQKVAVQKLTNFAKQHGAHIHLVAHPRKGADESRAPGKLDVGGSSRITDSADNVFSVWSARKEEGQEDEDPGSIDAILELHKQRNGETQHRKLHLWFNKAAQQFTTSPERKAVPYVQFSARRPQEVEGGVNG